MSFTELKEQIMDLDPTEREELKAVLVALEEANAAGHQAEMAKKIDDSNEENWVSYDDFKDAMPSLDKIEASTKD